MHGCMVCALNVKEKSSIEESRLEEESMLEGEKTRLEEEESPQTGGGV